MSNHNDKKIKKISMDKVDIWSSVSIGTSIAIGSGSGMAIGIASDSVYVGILTGSIFAILVGVVTMRKK